MIEWLAKATGLSSGLVTAALVVAAIGGLGLAKCAYDNSVIEEHEAGRAAAAAPANDAAARARVTDAIANARNEEDLHDAIDSAPVGELSPAARALACEQLRQSGTVPPAGRCEGGGRAAPDAAGDDRRGRAGVPPSPGRD